MALSRGAPPFLVLKTLLSLDARFGDFKRGDLCLGDLDLLRFGDLDLLCFGDLDLLRFGDLDLLRFGDLDLLCFGDLDLLRFGDLDLLCFGDLDLLRFGDLDLPRFGDRLYPPLIPNLPLLFIFKAIATACLCGTFSLTNLEILCETWDFTM